MTANIKYPTQKECLKVKDPWLLLLTLSLFKGRGNESPAYLTTCRKLKYLAIWGAKAGVTNELGVEVTGGDVGCHVLVSSPEPLLHADTLQKY